MKIAVLGAGHGGYAMAAELSMVGYEVNLYELPEFEENLRPIREKGGIHLIARRPPAEEFQLPAGGRSGFAKITGKVTSNMEEAVKDVGLIMLVVPALGRERFIKELAPYLRDGQILVIWPAYFGALQALEILKREGVKKDITIAETESLIYLCFKVGPGKVWIKDYKRKLAIAALPARRNPEVIERLTKIYPQLVPASNVLETTLNNINLMLHPPCVLLNLYRVEAKFYPYSPEIDGPLASYYDVTPAMARVMEAVDKERILVGESLGLKLKDLRTMLNMFYESVGETHYETIIHTRPYSVQIGPTTVQHRFVTEDVPYGYVPVIQLGRQIGVKTPVMEALTTIACIVCGVNFWEAGLTLKKLGIDGMKKEEIMKMVS